MRFADFELLRRESRFGLLLRAFVHLGYGLGIDRHGECFRRGLVPDQTPYDFDRAEEMGCSLTFSTDHHESHLARFARRLVGKILGFDLVHALRNSSVISSSDVTWTMDERQYLAIAATITLRGLLKRPKLIGQTIWLFDKWDELSVPRKWLYKLLLRRVDQLTVHSAEYLNSVHAISPETSVKLLRFGISLRSFPHCKPRDSVNSPIRIFSPGRDRSRDWSTVLSAFGSQPEFDVVIVTNKLSDRDARKHSNVKVLRELTMDALRSYYNWADYVVLAMKENLYSGITVALQAVRMGVPLVCSRTGGVPTYFNEDETLFVPTNDPIALRTAVLQYEPDARALRAQRAQERFSKQEYSSDAMIRRYVEISRKLLQDCDSHTSNFS